MLDYIYLIVKMYWLLGRRWSIADFNLILQQLLHFTCLFNFLQQIISITFFCVLTAAVCGFYLWNL